MPKLPRTLALDYFLNIITPIILALSSIALLACVSFGVL